MSERTLARLLPVAVLILGSLTLAPSTVSASEPYTYSDDSGDVFVFGQSAPVPATSVPPTAPFDLVELGITDEDETGMTFHLAVVDFQGAVTVPIINGGREAYSLYAVLDGSTINYRLTWFPRLPEAADAPTGIEPVDASFCVDVGEEGSGGPDEPPEGGSYYGSECYYQNVEATVDWDTNRLSAYVTKSALMGLEPVDAVPPPAELPQVALGSRLSGIYAESGRFFPVPMSDRLPNEGGIPEPYVFQTTSANLKIRLGLDQGETAVAPGEGEEPREYGYLGTEGAKSVGEVSATPGIPTLIALRVENTNAAKRIINLTASLLDGDSGGWKFQIAPTIQVPGGDSRVVNLIVNATAGVAHRDQAIVLVRGQSLGFPDEVAATRLTVTASVPPGPDRQELHFHAAPETSDTFTGTACAIFRCTGDEAWMNTLATDAKGTLDDGVSFQDQRIFGPTAVQFLLWFPLDTPLPRDLLLDVETPIELQLGFSTPAEFPAQVAVDVYTTGSYKLVATGQSSATISSSTPVELSFLPLRDSARISVDDERLQLRLTVTVNTGGPGAAALGPDFKFVPSSSMATFPFIPDPMATAVSVLAGPAFITLAPGSDVEQFLNPGRTKIFNATVLNEGIQLDTVQLDIIHDNPKWSISVVPGSRFALPPGDGAKFALLVRAPEDAQENDQIRILINATSSLDPNVKAQLHLAAIVTKGMDIPDEADLYQADAESKSKVITRPDGGRAPGFEAVLILLAMTVGLLALRRRRQD